MVQLSSCVVVVKARAGGWGQKGKKMEEAEFEANVLGENLKQHSGLTHLVNKYLLSDP